MLITHGPGTGDHSYNAVRGEFIKAGSTERRRSGAYRKVVKFGENLVMGYTGEVDAAKILLDDFAGRFSGRAATIETLRAALQQLNIQLHNKIAVVGWIADPVPQCFRWTANYGARIEFVDSAIEGSGASHFVKLLADGDGLGSPGFDDIGKAIYFAITKSAKIIGSELSDMTVLRNNYGFATDIAYWSGSSFQFHKKSVFNFLNLRIQQDGSYEFQPILIRIYENHDRYSLLLTRHAHETVGPDGSRGRHTFYEMVTSIHDECDDVPMPTQLLTLRDAIYCFGIAFVDRRSNNHGTFFVTVDEENVDIIDTGKTSGMSLKNSKYFIDMLSQVAAQNTR